MKQRKKEVYTPIDVYIIGNKQTNASHIPSYHRDKTVVSDIPFVRILSTM